MLGGFPGYFDSVKQRLDNECNLVEDIGIMWKITSLSRHLMVFIVWLFVLSSMQKMKRHIKINYACIKIYGMQKIVLVIKGFSLPFSQAYSGSLIAINHCFIFIHLFITPNIFIISSVTALNEKK